MFQIAAAAMTAAEPPRIPNQRPRRVLSLVLGILGCPPEEGLPGFVGTLVSVALGAAVGLSVGTAVGSSVGTGVSVGTDVSVGTGVGV